MSIARRNGPAMQVLTHEGEWANEPLLLTAFMKPAMYEAVSAAEARKEAESIRITWPVKVAA